MLNAYNGIIFNNGILFTNKKEQTTDACNDIDELQKHLLSERSQRQTTMYYYFNYIVSRKDKTISRSRFVGLRAGVFHKVELGNFGGITE